LPQLNAAGMVLAVKAGDKLLRFAVTDPNKLQFLTQDPNSIGKSAVDRSIWPPSSTTSRSVAVSSQATQ
jgi:hypothetical protein